MDGQEEHTRILFWERSLCMGRPCRMCEQEMFSWHDIKGMTWELCQNCDIA
jgi:hypothetical protein